MIKYSLWNIFSANFFLIFLLFYLNWIFPLILGSFSACVVQTFPIIGFSPSASHSLHASPLWCSACLPTYLPACFSSSTFLLLPNTPAVIYNCHTLFPLQSICAAPHIQANRSTQTEGVCDRFLERKTGVRTHRLYVLDRIENTRKMFIAYVFIYGNILSYITTHACIQRVHMHS